MDDYDTINFSDVMNSHINFSPVLQVKTLSQCYVLWLME